jgi:hypothetical protein
LENVQLPCQLVDHLPTPIGMSSPTFVLHAGVAPAVPPVQMIPCVIVVLAFSNCTAPPAVTRCWLGDHEYGATVTTVGVVSDPATPGPRTPGSKAARVPSATANNMFPPRSLIATPLLDITDFADINDRHHSAPLAQSRCG